MITEETAILDPKEFSAERVELGLDELGLAIRADGVDWGEADIAAQLARQSIGAVVTDRHLEPVEMTIPLMVKGEGKVSLAEAANRLEQKVALLQREGGWIRRDFEAAGGFAGSVGYQILKASISGLQGWLFADQGIAEDVTIKILRSPLCYSTEEVESEVFEETEARELVGTLSEVLGTAPGLMRIRVTNEGEEHWRACTLAMESRDHPQDETADTTAALAYDCADLTMKGGAEAAEIEGIDVIEHASLTKDWRSILNSEIAGVGHMTHIGVRRIWIRAEAPSGEAEDVQLRLRWRSLGTVQWSENSIVRMAVVGSYQVYDLGEARVETASLGDQRWEWELRARAVSGSGAVRFHRAYPLPAEQFCAVKTPKSSSGVEEGEENAPQTVTSDATVGSKAWANPSNAKKADSSFASVALSGGALSNYLWATGFDFAVPSGAVVLGVAVHVKRKQSAEGVRDSRVRLIKGGKPGTTDRSAESEWPAENMLQTYGGEDDSFGETLTAADVNASDFGVAIEVENPGSESTAYVDSITITVYYSENVTCFASRAIEFATDGINRQHLTEDIWGRLIPEGFYPYSPPSGIEERALRGILIPSQGDLGEQADSGSNPLKAQILYRPAYLFASEASA